MSKCKRNIFFIFGYLLIMAVLIVPCIEKSQEYQKLLGVEARGLPKVVKEQRKWIFFPVFFINRDSKVYKINSEQLATEIAFILLTGGFAYILFCVVLRKEKGE